MMNTEQISSTRMLDESEIPSDGALLDGVNLADYELIERIGAGGYGEVWRATGPGGLPKAVKVLYGERTGKHAEAEFKSLERMRDLRHPFLLSIERIEVIDSRLIVVTELADCNLQERFDSHRDNGNPGIPRDELLGYLRDAADALDFMTEQHGLQHLDIKPDNLLLQGNHAKVGDFGLAKNLDATNVSIVNGFTPMYAAPELFEGRPGRATDQYSLAIVYQVMLTGASPFNGRTAAQLTAQHLRSQPDLTNLQPIDRPVIARALSKNANSRFENCRELVDELSRRKHSRSSGRTFVAASSSDELNRTALVDSKADTGSVTISAQASTPVPYSPVPSAQRVTRPVIIIGVGGVAGDVLNRTKDLHNQCAPETAVSYLQIDSDRSALSSIVNGGAPNSLTPDETLPIPLRSSSEYRSASNLNLSWMSRRWLFNIPRSGQVEGIRPLGRLALCDHSETVRRRLKELMSDAVTSGESDGIDIYVVASTAGGTGSGAVADLGLMVRGIAESDSISNVKVSGVLLHATGFTRNVTDVQDANTVCTLRELRHLQTPGLGTPRGFEHSAYSVEAKAFDYSYFVHFGNGLNDARMSKRILEVANYLFVCASTDARLDFSAWRTPNEHLPKNPTQIRLLGLSCQDATSLETASKESGRLAEQLLRRWCGPTTEFSGKQSDSLPALLTDTQTLLLDLQLTRDTLPPQVAQVLRGEAGKEIEAFAERAFVKCKCAFSMDRGTRQDILDILRAEIASPGTEDNKTVMNVVSSVQKIITATTKTTTTRLITHLTELLDSPHRLKSTMIATDHVASTLSETLEACAALEREIETMLTGLTQKQSTDATFSESGELVDGENVRAFCKQYCALFAYQTISHCFTGYIQHAENSIKVWRSRLRALYGQMHAEIKSMSDGATTLEEIPAPVVDAFDRWLRTDSPKLLSRAAQGAEGAEAFAPQLCSASMKFLVSASSVKQNAANSSHTNDKAFPQNVWPEIHSVGGRRRVLAMIPRKADRERWETTLREEFGDCVASRSNAADSVSVICEVESVPVELVLSRLTHNNPHVSDVASRIHTRVDIDW